MTCSQLGLLTKTLSLSEPHFVPLWISRTAPERRCAVEMRHCSRIYTVLPGSCWSLCGAADLPGLTSLLASAAQGHTAGVIWNLWSVLSALLSPGISPDDSILPRPSVVLCIPPEVRMLFPNEYQIRCLVLQPPAPEPFCPYLVTFSKLSSLLP